MAAEPGNDPDPTAAPADGASGPIVPVVESAAIVPATGIVVSQADQNPALVYLASLGPSSRRTMRGALDVMARLVSGGEATAETLPWHTLRRRHTAAIRALSAIDLGFDVSSSFSTILFSGDSFSDNLLYFPFRNWCVREGEICE